MALNASHSAGDSGHIGDHNLVDTYLTRLDKSPLLVLVTDTNVTNARACGKALATSGQTVIVHAALTWFYTTGQGVGWQLASNGYDLTGWYVSSASLGICSADGSNRKSVSWVSPVTLGTGTYTLAPNSPNSVDDTAGTITATATRLTVPSNGVYHAFASLELQKI